MEQAHEKELDEIAESSLAEITELQEKLEEELEKGMQSEKHCQELEQKLNKQEEQFEEEANDYEAKIAKLTE